MQEENQVAPADEWLKFGALVVVLVIVVAVVALSRPLIFGRIVPAVMGDGQMPPPAAPVEEPAPVEAEPEVSATAVPAETQSAGDTEIFIPAAESGGAGGVPAYPVEGEAVEMPTAVNTITHIVQPGENLTLIAQRYGVLVAEIVTANRLANPNQVNVGDQLLIPQP